MVKLAGQDLDLRLSERSSAFGGDQAFQDGFQHVE
jgi:hypothetical protein